MLRKVNGFITWGEINEKTLLNLFSKKSNLTPEMIKRNLNKKNKFKY